MSGREWQPGDLGVTAKGRLALRRANSPDGWIDQDGAPWSTKKFPANVRPLVVIDPEDREQVDRLTKALVEAAHKHGNWAVSDGGIHPDTTTAALREFADPKPPRPEEPTGLGAVVEDADGVRWLNNRFDSTITWVTPWFSSDLDEWREFKHIDAVRVLSEGVVA